MWRVALRACFLADLYCRSFVGSSVAMNAVRSAHSRVIAAAAPTWLPFGSRSFRWRALSLTQRVDTDARRLTKLKIRSAGQRTGTYEKNAIFSAWVMRRIGASG